jgi:bile acid:Na+ symporter, BASS family
MVKTLIDVVVPAINFILLVAVGLDLTADDFARVRRHRVLVLTGLFAPLFILPPIALLVTSAIQTNPDVTAGMLLIAACPIGGISNAYSYLARASTALSVTLTGLSCLFASVTIPLVGQALERAVGQALDLAAPVPLLFAQLVLVLALPLVIGMLIRRRLPDVAARSRPALQLLAFSGIAIVFLLIILDAPDAFVSGLVSTALPAGAFVLASMGAGWLTAMLVTTNPQDRFTLAAEFGTRNIAVAIAIAVTLLGRVEFARFATTYALVEVPLMLAAIALFRRRQTQGSAERTESIA